MAIDALERWYLERPEDLQRYLNQIVPCMTDYLMEVEVVELTEARSRQSANKSTLQSGSIKHNGEKGIRVNYL